MKALDFVDDFKKMMADYEQAQRGISILGSQKQELEKGIQELENDKEKILAGIDEERKKSVDAINAGRLNADRIFKQENVRLDQRYKELEGKEKECKAMSTALTQLQNELADKEEKLRVREEVLGKDLLLLDTKQKALDGLKESLELLQMKLDSEEKQIKQEKNNNLLTLQDIEEGMRNLKAAQARNREEKERLQKTAEAQVARDNELNHREIELNKLNSAIDKEKTQLEIQQRSNEKQKKDNDDKERALNALKLEIDFKIAKLEKGAK